jgi:hypothetical protein
MMSLSYQLFIFQCQPTSQTLSIDSSSQAFHPIDILLCLLENDWMAFLQDFVYGDQCFECLYLVCQYRLPALSSHSVLHGSAGKKGGRGWVSAIRTYTFMPAQNDWEVLWSHV